MCDGCRPEADFRSAETAARLRLVAATRSQLGKGQLPTQSGPWPICSSNGRFLIAAAVRGNGHMQIARQFLPFELISILRPLLFSYLAQAQKSPQLSEQSCLG